MSKYFQAKNDTQDVIIDDEHQNLFLVRKGVISLNYKELWHPTYSDNFPYYDRQLLKLNKDNGEVFIAFKPADGSTLHIYSNPFNSEADRNIPYLCEAFVKKDMGNTVEVSPSSFEYFVYGVLPKSIQQHYGLQIVNAEGQVVYSSNYKPLRVIDSGLVNLTSMELRDALESTDSETFFKSTHKKEGAIVPCNLSRASLLSKESENNSWIIRTSFALATIRDKGIMKVGIGIQADREDVGNGYVLRFRENRDVIQANYMLVDVD